MISLVTTAPEWMFQPDGLRVPFEALRTDAIALTQRLAEVDESKVIVFDRDGQGLSNEQAAGATSPVIANFSQARSASETHAAMAAMLSLIKLTEAFFGVGPRRRHVSAIIDLDYYFYPTAERGTFTLRFANSPELIGLINSHGEYLASLDGDLLLFAALSQHPQRLKKTLDDFGWTWVRHRDGGFEHVCGPMPWALQEAFSKSQELSNVEWSKPMTIQELAHHFKVHRNTMTKRLKSSDLPNRKNGTLYQVPADRLPKK